MSKYILNWDPSREYCHLPAPLPSPARPGEDWKPNIAAINWLELLYFWNVPSKCISNRLCVKEILTVTSCLCHLRKCWYCLGTVCYHYLTNSCICQKKVPTCLHAGWLVFLYIVSSQLTSSLNCWLMSSAPFNSAAFTFFPVCVMQHVKLIAISVQYWFSDLYIYKIYVWECGCNIFFFSLFFF